MLAWSEELLNNPATGEEFHGSVMLDVIKANENCVGLYQRS